MAWHLGTPNCRQSVASRFSPIITGTRLDLTCVAVISLHPCAGFQHQPAGFSASTRITSKNQVTRFGLLVAGEAAFHKCRVARFAVCEVSEPPAAGCSVLFRVLDHKLNVRGLPGNERLSLAKDLVVFL